MGNVTVSDPDPNWGPDPNINWWTFQNPDPNTFQMWISYAEIFNPPATRVKNLGDFSFRIFFQNVCRFMPTLVWIINVWTISSFFWKNMKLSKQNVAVVFQNDNVMWQLLLPEYFPCLCRQYARANFFLFFDKFT